jgi:hypothetical protein
MEGNYSRWSRHCRILSILTVGAEKAEVVVTKESSQRHEICWRDYALGLRCESECDRRVTLQAASGICANDLITVEVWWMLAFQLYV